MSRLTSFYTRLRKSHPTSGLTPYFTRVIRSDSFPKMTPYYTKVRQAAEFTMSNEDAMRTLGVTGTGDANQDKFMLKKLLLKYHPDRAKGNKDVNAFQMSALNALWENFIRQGKSLPTGVQPQQQSGATVGGSGSEAAVYRVVRERLGQASEGANRLLRTFNTPAAQMKDVGISPRACATMISQIGKYAHSATEAIRINLAPTGRGKSPMEGIYRDLLNAEGYIKGAASVMLQSGNQADQKLIDAARNYLNEFLKIVTNVMRSTGTKQSSRHRISVSQFMDGLTPYYTRIRTAAEKAGDTPPDLGQVSELVRNTLTKEYDIYPPNLSTAIQPDGGITITAMNPDTGLNLQITLRNLAGNVVYSGGQITGVVPAQELTPPEGGQ